MRHRSVLLVLLACAVAAVPALAAAFDGKYTGKATNLAGDFKYGKVTVKVAKNKVTYLEIEAVTTSGCGGFMDVVFAPKDPETQIIGGSAKIGANGGFKVKYRPVRSIEDQHTTIKARFSGGKVRGTFASTDLCVNEGRFSAKR
jgi:hypothetical protein